MVIGNDEHKISYFKSEFRGSFETFELGLLHYYLGVEFLHTDKGIYML